MYQNISKNQSGKRTHKIDRITPHCVVGQWTAKKIADYFASTTRHASCNYGIGVDGDVSISVPEDCRSWCSSNAANDQRAVTIECASDTVHPYIMNENVINSLFNLATDICKRHNKTQLLWIPDKNERLNYIPKSNEMVITLHRDFANKACPGDFLVARLPEMAKTVTSNLTAKKLYKVQTGAFKNKANAEDYAKLVRHTGFDTYIRYYDGLYHVQVGAFRDIINAVAMEVKLKQAGFSTYITEE